MFQAVGVCLTTLRKSKKCSTVAQGEQGREGDAGRGDSGARSCRAWKPFSLSRMSSCGLVRAEVAHELLCLEGTPLTALLKLECRGQG